MGKKYNQALVSDTDREIPTLRSTDNSRNSVNKVSGIIRLPSVGISRSASETDDRFSFGPCGHTISYLLLELDS